MMALEARFVSQETGPEAQSICDNVEDWRVHRPQRFRDSEALIEHAESLGDLIPAILAIVSVVHGELLGEPSEELKAKLADSEVPQVFTP
jgi:hypothetical protein